MAPYTIEAMRAAYRNAESAGDKQAADAIFAQLLKSAQANAPQENYNPTEGNSFGQNLQEGIGRGMVNVGRHAGNLVGLVSDEQLADAKQLDAPLMDTGGGMVGSMLGEAAVTAPLAGGASAGLLRAGGAAAKVAGNPITRGIAEGAMQGGLMADPGSKGEGAMLGGAVGGLLPAGMSVGGKLVRGMNRTPEAEALLRQGVDLTPGQMNPHGMFNQLEESWQSAPIVGPIIKGARDNATQDWQRAVVQQGAAPGQTIAKASGQDMLDAAYQGFDPAYAAGKGFPVGAKIMRTQGGGDVPLSQAFDQTGQRARFGLTPEGRANTVDWSKQNLNELVNQARQSGNGLQSDDLLQFRSLLRQQKRGLDVSDPANRAQAQMLGDLEQKVTQALESQLPPDAMAAVRAADAQYGQYKIAEGAMGRAGDQVAGMTPAKLSQSVKAATDDAAYARGAGGPMRDLAQQGGAAFERVSPPTGARMAAFGVPAAAAMANPWVGIPVAAGTLGLTATKTGRKLAAGNTAAQKQAQALIDAMRAKTPELGRDVAEQYLQRLLVAGTAQR